MRSISQGSLWTLSLLTALATPVWAVGQEQSATQLQKPETARYTLVDLGVVGPPPGQAFNVTNNGLVSLSAASPGNKEHAYIWYMGVRFDIGNRGLGGGNSAVFNVNKWVQAVGQADTSTVDPKGEDFCGFRVLGYSSAGTCLPFLWENGVMNPLPTLSGNNGAANMINDRGEAVGEAETKVADPNCPAPQILQFKPVRWLERRAYALPTYGNDVDGIALAVNDHGQAVGGSGDCTKFNQITFINLQSLHALLWENRRARDLGNLGGTGHGSGNLAFNLNNRRHVVGDSDLPGDTTFHAFLWTRETGIQDLDTLAGDFASVGLAINDRDDVVGVSLDSSFNPRAFLWRNGKMTSLNKVIPANSQLVLWTACSINSTGEIVGLAQDKKTGEFHSYLLSPRNSDDRW